MFAAGVFEPGVATADFNRWGKRPSWSSEEAVALTLGKDPDLVNWERVQNYVGYHAFADEYAELRERIGRAEAVGELAFPIKPEQFVMWLERDGIRCPEELGVALTALSGHAGSKEDPNGNLAAQRSRLQDENDTLRQRISELELQLQENPPGWMNTRTSLLRLVIAMAIKGYAWDPKKARTTTVREIKSDLNELGLDLDEGTILGCLRTAASEVLSGPD